MKNPSVAKTKTTQQCSTESGHVSSVLKEYKLLEVSFAVDFRHLDWNV
jgi:hypothetical protein